MVRRLKSSVSGPDAPVGHGGQVKAEHLTEVNSTRPAPLGGHSLTTEAERAIDAPFQQLADGLPHIVWAARPDGWVDYCNKRWLDYAGMTWGQTEGWGWRQVVHPDDLQQCIHAWTHALQTGMAYEVEYRLRRAADSAYRWHLGRAQPVRHSQGQVLKWLGTCTDIHEQMETLQTQRQALAAACDEVERLTDRLSTLTACPQEETRLRYSCGVLGHGAAIQKVKRQMDQVAATNSTVLLLGETGTGKELLAHAIHNASPRCGRPMVTLNCAALPATLVESELFGREKGAYTGALTRLAGRFELADGSTLFLDEIGELPLEAQVKLLRVVEEGRFERVGGVKTLRVDVRIIAATNRDLDQAVDEGRFRRDLFYRLNVFPIRMPPLRERREDIPLLVWAFVREFGRSMGKTIDAIADSTLEALLSYPWPGNVRELRNVIERAMIVAHGPGLPVELPSVPNRPAAAGPGPLLPLDELERRHILAALERTHWRVSGQRGAAAILGLKPTTLESKMAKLRIARAD
jgi:PAS domain S-box-containing protein